MQNYKVKANPHISKLYTLVAVMSPLLNMYGISRSYNTFTFREVFMIIILVICLAYKIKYKDVTIQGTKTSVLLYITAIIISFLINSLYGEDNLLRVLRYFLLLTYTFFFADEYFDINFGKKIYKYISLFASFYLLLQVLLANTIGYGLRGYLTILPTRTPKLVAINLTRRFYSIFEEPGYFGMFVAGYLVIALFSHKKEMFTAFVIILAALLSTSTTSITSIAFVIGCFLITKNYEVHGDKKSNWIIGTKIFIIILALVAIYVFLHSRQYETVVHRLTMESSTDDRLSSYSDFSQIISEMSLIQLIFGNCMNEYPIGGYALMIISFGLLGSFFMLKILLSSLKYTDVRGKILLFLFLFINIGCSEFIGSASTIVVYFSFILSYKKYNMEET